jgi:hypothetical protein
MDASERFFRNFSILLPYERKPENGLRPSVPTRLGCQQREANTWPPNVNKARHRLQLTPRSMWTLPGDSALRPHARKEAKLDPQGFSKRL